MPGETIKFRDTGSRGTCDPGDTQTLAQGRSIGDRR